MRGSPAAGASPEIRIGDSEDVIEWLAADLEDHLRHPADDRARRTLAIPGGSVGERCFPRLAKPALDWSRIEFFWVDERAVPPDDPQSNFGLANRLWLAPAGVPTARIHRMRGEAADLDRAAREYAEELTGIAGDPPRLDYVLLGVGADGHVASLFPAHRALHEAGPVLAIVDAAAPRRRRLTLALPVLTGAARVAIVAFGATKAPVIRAALEGPGSTLPVARVAGGARRCLVLLDREAGGEVGAGS